MKQVVERFAWGLALNLLSVHAAQGLIIYRGRGNARTEELKKLGPVQRLYVKRKIMINDRRLTMASLSAYSSKS